MLSAAPRTVGILGGMGPAAGADFARLFVAACEQQLVALGEPVNDQAFPEHWLAQVPVPDRTGALRASHAHPQPLDAMLIALGRLTALGATSVAMACNTAHAWHAPLQDRFPQVELLHMADEVARTLLRAGKHEACLLATEGTYLSGVYARAFASAGIVLHLPDAPLRTQVMRGIYQGVKAGRMAYARRRFLGAIARLVRRHPGSAIVLGCTEIPLALREEPAVPAVMLVDPAQVLAQALAARAYA